jgi:hypothetical protein
MLRSFSQENYEISNDFDNNVSLGFQPIKGIWNESSLILIEQKH